MLNVYEYRRSAEGVFGSRIKISVHTMASALFLCIYPSPGSVNARNVTDHTFRKQTHHPKALERFLWGPALPQWLLGPVKYRKNTGDLFPSQHPLVH